MQFFLVELPLLVLPAHAHPLGAQHVLVEVGNAQAALVVVLLLAHILHNLGVDERMFLTDGAVGVGLLVVGAETDDHQADREVHLWCGQPHAFGGVHSLIHIGDKLLQFGIVLVDRLSHLAQRGVAVAGNR